MTATRIDPGMTTNATCRERWPECRAFGYDSRCCRFPRACTAGLEPVADDSREEG